MYCTLDIWGQYCSIATGIKAHDLLFIHNDCKMYHRQPNTLYLQRWHIMRREFLALSRFMLCYPRQP